MSRIFSFFLFVLALAAEPADFIWSARYVITMDAQRHVIENGAVAIQGDRILAVGTRAEIDARFQAKQRLDRPDARSEEHTSELQSPRQLLCRLLLEKK